MLPMIAAAYFVEQRSFHCLSAHNFGFYNSDKQREGEADLSLPLICHTAQAVAARWKQPDPCTRLAAEIPSCNKVGLGVREISIRVAGKGADVMALLNRQLEPAGAPGPRRQIQGPRTYSVTARAPTARPGPALAWAAVTN